MSWLYGILIIAIEVMEKKRICSGVWMIRN